MLGQRAGVWGIIARACRRFGVFSGLDESALCLLMLCRGCLGLVFSMRNGEVVDNNLT